MYPNQQDPFSDPVKAPIGPSQPTLRNLGERTGGLGPWQKGSSGVIAMVLKEKKFNQPNPFFKPGEPEDPKKNRRLRDILITDLIIFEGPAFMYGGDDKLKPDNLGPFPVPGVCFDWQIDRPIILADIPDHMVGGGVVIGRFKLQAPKGQGNPYWVLETVDPAERSRFFPVYEAYKAGQLPTHVPPPPEAAMATGTPNAGAYTGGYPAGQAPPQPLPSAPPVVTPYVQQAQPYGPMGGYAAPVNPQQPYWPQQGQPAAPVSAPAAPMPVPQPQPVAAAPVDNRPANWPPDQWAALSDVQRQMVLTQAAAQAPASAPTY